MRTVTARCLCGAISYEIKGEFGPAFNCHCWKCRRWHGSAFRSRASVGTDQFRWLSGVELVSRYNSSEHVTKCFCSVCGSNLISTYDDRPEVIGVPLGALEQDPGVAPRAHIFVGSKSPWYEITDDLPQHDEWPSADSHVHGRLGDRLPGRD